MPNQYLYLSSKNSDDHADFNCDLPNGLRVSPYSQLRVLFSWALIPRSRFSPTKA